MSLQPDGIATEKAMLEPQSLQQRIQALEAAAQQARLEALQTAARLLTNKSAALSGDTHNPSRVATVAALQAQYQGLQSKIDELQSKIDWLHAQEHEHRYG